jgi:hypothetical protein
MGFIIGEEYLMTHQSVAARISMLILTAVLILGLALPALADARDISVGGIWICRITNDLAGFTSYDRAVQINKRITEILSAPQFRQGATITVKADGNDSDVYVGDRLVFTVAPVDTEGNVTTDTLARQWAHLLAQGLNKAIPSSSFYF